MKQSLLSGFKLLSSVHKTPAKIWRLPFETTISPQLQVQNFWALKLLASSLSEHHLFSAFISKWSQHDLSRHAWTLDTWSLQGYVRNQNVIPKSGRVNGLWALWLLCRSVWVQITIPGINTGSKDTTRLVWIKEIPSLYSGTWGDTNLGFGEPARGCRLPNTTFWCGSG